MPALPAVFLILCVLLPGSPALAFPGEPDGFRGIPWNTGVESLPGLIEAGGGADTGRVRVYRRENEDLTFGRARLDSIFYEFREGRFFRVQIRVTDIYNFLLLRDALFHLHGPGRELSPRAERYEWYGERSRMLLLSNFDIS